MAATAVVTGASGFVASHLVQQLLQKGYNVRGTVRSVANKDKTAHLTALADSLPGTLELCEADLLKQGSFDKVIEGADYVFHTASPFFMKVEDPQRDLVDPAVNGTKNVLSSVAKNKSTVKRVVLTSSFASVMKMKAGPSNPPLYTEDDWNTDSTISDDAYSFSKVSAERAAWEIAEKEGLDLVVVNPTFVIGPVISKRADATSINTVTAILEGKSADIIPFVCDVRDVARAHVLAAEKPDAKGRHIVSQQKTWGPKAFTDTLKQRFPSYKIQDGPAQESSPVIDNSKALKTLGLGKLHEPTESIVDMAVTLIQQGIAKPQTA